MDDRAEFFTDVPGPIPFRGLESDDPLTFKVYDPERLVLGKRLEDHLRIAVCLWHSFNWPGSDVFGAGTFDRPWLLATDDPMRAARQKVDAAFEFIEKLGAPFFCFHDRDVAPEGDGFAQTSSNLGAMLEHIERHMERTGAKLRREGPAIGTRSLDHVYPDPGPPALVHWPTVGLRVGWEGPIRAVVVHTTPTSFCIEPQTAWPNAPALAARGSEETGIVRLPAGGTLAATMHWRWWLTGSY